MTPDELWRREQERGDVERERHNAYKRRWRHENREAYNAQMKRWRDAHREEYRAYNRDWMRRYRAELKRGGLHELRCEGPRSAAGCTCREVLIGYV